MSKEQSHFRHVTQNRKARFNYFIEEELEAGLALMGSEVKSLRDGKVSIEEAYAAEQAGELWLLNARIDEFPQSGTRNHEPRRPRKLLVKRKEMAKMLAKISAKGYTLVPMSLYFNDRGFAKIKLGLGKGKREFDKRETVKERDWNRQKAGLLKRG